MDIRDNKYRSELMERYLEAETTVSEERELAEYFRVHGCLDGRERAIAAAVGTQMAASGPQNCTDAREDEFDAVMGRKRRGWVTGAWVAGLAAALAALTLIFVPSYRKAAPQTDNIALIDRLCTLTETDLQGAVSYEFNMTPDGLVMTAHFIDGQSVAFSVKQLDEEGTIRYYSLNDNNHNQ